jgi:hypothetical protein
MDCINEKTYNIMLIGQIGEHQLKIRLNTIMAKERFVSSITLP